MLLRLQWHTESLSNDLSFLGPGLNSVLPKIISPLSANPKKWSNTLKQFVGKSRELFEYVLFDHFVGLAYKKLMLSKFKR